MDLLKKLFPYSFGTKDVANLVIKTIVYIVVTAVLGALIGLSTILVAWIPVVGLLVAWLLGIISSLAGIYCLAGIIVLFLDYFKVLK